jgi:SAM-dependent methyltransferase
MMRHPAAMPHSTSSGLDRGHFQCIGSRGVTSPYNSYAHSMCWYRDRLYVGTFRNSLCLIKRTGRSIPPPKMGFWPVYCPDCEDPESLRAEIIAYDPRSGEWELVHRSTMVEEQGRQMPRDLGYRGMGVFQSQSDSAPCLYTGNISRHGCVLLRSEDGRSFHDAGPELEGTSIRTLLPFRGKLYTSLIGKKGHHGNESFNTTLLESADPQSGLWTVASPAGVGDPSNTAIFDIEEFQGQLYVSTMNHISGCQVWKSDLSGQPPYRWKRVLSAGGYRGFLNEFGLKLTAFGECLYLATGIAGGGYDRVHQRGPAAAEIMRIWPDDSWDLVVGTPRLTPEGMKFPTSGMGAGFDNFLNGYMWFMEVHEGWLYIGTFNGAAFFPFQPHGLQSKAAIDSIEQYIRTAPARSLDDFLLRYGGCDLWRTQDGERFYPITRNGFENVYNMGIRRMVSTPHGLFVGTSNPFGPLVGVKADGEWTYQENSRGGIEIWLGHRDSAPPSETSPGGRTRSQQRHHAPLKMRRRFHAELRRNLPQAESSPPPSLHLGLWPRGTATPHVACRHLVETVLSLVERPAGPILDAGCLCGATTRLVADQLGAESVLGIDEVQSLIDHATVQFPGLRFLTMDPRQLEFADASFGSVVSFEQAVSFDTRADFLREAYRVLRPGGQLLLADLLMSRDAIVAQRGLRRTNYLRGPDAYGRMLRRIGFGEHLIMRDVTRDVMKGYANFITGDLIQRYASRELTEQDFNRAMGTAAEPLLTVKQYLLIAATKPL